MSKAKHPRSRWVDGYTPRYDEYSLAYIARRYKEADGWHRGARVTKR